MRAWIVGIVFLLVGIIASLRGFRPVFARGRRVLRFALKSRFAVPVGIPLLALAVYALPSLIWRVPTPSVHDEFAYLLQGDTFAHGRLSNPPHRMAAFFETFHVLQSPTYAAKFPPAMGLALAVGFWLGLPIAGIWISLALACAAVYWMLRAMFPVRHAAMVTLLGALHPTVIWFSQTYWGGGVSILGGALLAGAMLRTSQLKVSVPFNSKAAPKIKGTHTFILGIAAGAGIGILALSRPFEGLLFSAACAIAMFCLAWKGGWLRMLINRFAPAALIAPAIAIAWFMYYDWRVTGQPLVMPYVLHTARYMVAPLFFWQNIPSTPLYPNHPMQQFHMLTEFNEYSRSVGWDGYWLGILDRGGMIAWAYFRPALLVLPLAAAIVAARRNARWRGLVFGSLGICASVLLIHLLTCPWMRIAYMAPLFGLILVVLAIGLRHMSVWRWNGHPVGRAAVRGLLAAHLCVAAFILVEGARTNANLTIARRSDIIHDLEHSGGKHVVFVSYPPGFAPLQEWVYNGADVDDQDVIFARYFDDRASDSLLRYYPDRTAWRVDVSKRNVKLSQLPATARGKSTSPDTLTTVGSEPCGCE